MFAPEGKKEDISKILNLKKGWKLANYRNIGNEAERGLGLKSPETAMKALGYCVCSSTTTELMTSHAASAGNMDELLVDKLESNSKPTVQ